MLLDREAAREGEHLRLFLRMMTVLLIVRRLIPKTRSCIVIVSIVHMYYNSIRRNIVIDGNES